MSNKKEKIEVYYPETYKLRILKVAETKGITMAELIRRATDDYLEKHDS